MKLTTHILQSCHSKSPVGLVFLHYNVPSHFSLSPFPQVSLFFKPLPFVITVSWNPLSDLRMPLYFLYSCPLMSPYRHGLLCLLLLPATFQKRSFTSQSKSRPCNFDLYLNAWFVRHFINFGLCLLFCLGYNYVLSLI